MTAIHQASLSITNSWGWFKLKAIESVMPSNYLDLCCPLFLMCSIFPSITVYSNESALHIRWSKYWTSATASVLPMNIQNWFPLGWTGLIFLQSAAAAAKSLQSCLTLCDPIDRSPPGSPVPGILQARTLEWVAISFSNAWKWKVKVKSLSCVQLLATPWTAAHQAPPSIGFSRQEYWSGVPLPSPGWSLLPTIWRVLTCYFSLLFIFFYEVQ